MENEITGDHQARARELVEELNPGVDQRIAAELVGSALGLLMDRPDPLDLKIAAAAMTRDARGVRGVRSVPRRPEGDRVRLGPHRDP